MTQPIKQSTAPAVYTGVLHVASEMAVEGIAKNRKNQGQGFVFRGIDDVLNSLSSKLVKANLIISPFVVERHVVERATPRGGALFYVTLTVDYTFTSAVDGSNFVVRAIGEAMDSGDKATNKAMSAAYKYAAFQTFCIPTDGDNDADAIDHAVVADTNISDEQFAELQKLIEETDTDPLKFEQHIKVKGLKNLPAARFDEAKSALINKKARAA